MQQLTLASTNLIELTGLQDAIDLSYPATATVVVDLLDAAGQGVAGATGIAMAFVAGTSGASSKYRGILPASVALVAGAHYTARVSVTTAAGGARRFDVPCTALAG